MTRNLVNYWDLGLVWGNLLDSKEHMQMRLEHGKGFDLRIMIYWPYLKKSNAQAWNQGNLCVSLIVF